MDGMNGTMAEVYVPYGGATSFKQLDDWMVAQDLQWYVSSTTYDFKTLTENILADSKILDKGSAISKLADEYQSRIEKGPKKKSILDRARDLVKSLGGEKNTDKAIPNGIACLKGLDGQDYWFGWVSNQWRDRDRWSDPQHGGEIFEAAAHKEYIEFLDQNPGMSPEFWCWHEPGTGRKSRATWWDFADGFLVMSGPLTPEEAQGLKSAPGPVGMSHGFFGLKDVGSGSIRRYRSYEVSDLPWVSAANPWTDLVTIQQEVKSMGFNPAKREYLVKVLGEDKVAALESENESRSKALLDAGIEFKDAPVENSTSEVTPPPTELDPPVELPLEGGKTVEAVDESTEGTQALEGFKAIEEAVVKVAEALSAMSIRLDEVESLMGRMATLGKSLEKSRDEQISEAMTPRLASALSRLQPKSASKSSETIVDDDQSKGPKLSGEMDLDPSVSWVREAIPQIRSNS